MSKIEDVVTNSRLGTPDARPIGGIKLRLKRKYYLWRERVLKYKIARRAIKNGADKDEDAWILIQNEVTPQERIELSDWMGKGKYNWNDSHPDAGNSKPKHKWVFGPALIEETEPVSEEEIKALIKAYDENVKPKVHDD